MWKKIAVVQMMLIIALAAFWIGGETRAAVEPAVREFTTSNEDGNIVYLWNYDSGKKEWNASALDFRQASYREVTIPARERLR